MPTPIRAARFLAIAAVSFALSSALGAAEPSKIWRSADGAFTVAARFVRIEVGRVVLAREDGGQVVSVPLERLDRESLVLALNCVAAATAKEEAGDDEGEPSLIPTAGKRPGAVATPKSAARSPALPKAAGPAKATEPPMTRDDVVAFLKSRPIDATATSLNLQKRIGEVLAELTGELKRRGYVAKLIGVDVRPSGNNDFAFEVQRPGENIPPFRLFHQNASVAKAMSVGDTLVLSGEAAAEFSHGSQRVLGPTRIDNIVFESIYDGFSRRIDWDAPSYISVYFPGERMKIELAKNKP